MKYFKICFLICLSIFCMTACSQSPSSDTDLTDPLPTESVQPTETPAQSTEEEEPFVPAPSLEVVDTVFYTSDYADGCIYMAARVKNTGNVIIGMDQWSSSFDVFGADGTLVLHEDHPELAPEVMKPGEYGYLSATVLDDTIDLAACAQVQCNVSWDTLVAIPDRIPIEDITPQEYSGNFYAFQGLLVNDKEFEVADITPVVVLLDPQTNAFLGVNIGHVVDSIPANGKIGTDGNSGAPIPLSAFDYTEVNPTVEAFGTYLVPIGG